MITKKLPLFTFVFLFILKNFSQSLYFPPTSGNNWDTLTPLSLNWCPTKIDSLYNYLDSNNSNSFILLKDGKIVLEKYFGTHTANSPWYWASAGKTITAFMTGIAQQEGYLSIQDTTSNYLGNGWTSCLPIKENKITIRNQLTMTSGLDDGVIDNDCTLDTCLIYKSDAGTRWAYHNAPYTLLDSVIESATGITLNNYTTQKLKTPTGMTGMFYSSGYNNVFFSNSRSMARFGLLTLNKGNWNGNQIMTDSVYFHDMTHTSQNLNRGYGYLWWLNGSTSFMVPQLQTVFPGQIYPNAPTDMITGVGTDAQCLIVVPSQNLVWIRMGNAPANGVNPFQFIDKIWQYINDFNCNSNVGFVNASATIQLKVYPNPVADQLNIETNETISNVELIDVLGRKTNISDMQLVSKQIPTDHIEKGIYLLKIYLKSGKSVTKTIYKL